VKDIAEMKLLHYETGADYIARAETRVEFDFCVPVLTSFGIRIAERVLSVRKFVDQQKDIRHMAGIFKVMEK
jgi:hypothetical protein